MKIILAVQVFNGGDYWRQCWESIVANQDIFERIFVSISNSPRQKEDIETVEKSPLPQLQLLVHDAFMTAVEHGRKFDHYLSSCELTGHIFWLCHDDILLRDGLLELKKLELDRHDAVFGPWCFFAEEGGRYPLTVRQFRQGHGGALTHQQFGFLIDQQLYAINISGLVLPAEIFKEKKFPWHLCAYGIRSEYLHLCNPEIKFVHQLFSPAVKIRQHAGSEGSLVNDRDNLFDTILYLNLAYEVYNREDARRFTIQSFGYLFRKFPTAGIKALLITGYRLRKEGYISTKTVAGIWCSLVFFLAQKVCNRIAGKIGRRRA